MGDGSFVLALPHSPDTPKPYVDPPSNTRKFIEALEKLGGGKKLFGVSDMRTCEEFIDLHSNCFLVCIIIADLLHHSAGSPRWLILG